MFQIIATEYISYKSTLSRIVPRLSAAARNWSRNREWAASCAARDTLSSILASSWSTTRVSTVDECARCCEKSAASRFSASAAPMQFKNWDNLALKILRILRCSEYSFTHEMSSHRIVCWNSGVWEALRATRRGRLPIGWVWPRIPSTKYVQYSIYLSTL